MKIGRYKKMFLDKNWIQMKMNYFRHWTVYYNVVINLNKNLLKHVLVSNLLQHCNLLLVLYFKQLPIFTEHFWIFWQTIVGPNLKQW